MILTLFLLFERIKKPIGEANYLPRISGINLTQLISKNSFCIIIYTSNLNARFDFINFAIAKYGSHIKFAIASMNESIAPKLLLNGEKTSFAIVPYKNGQKIETIAAPKTAIAFANWCEKITRPSNLRINHIDQLRRIFLEPGVALFGVNMISRPDYVKDNNIPFYLINQTYFKYLGISISSGLYIYRSSDRQLIKTGDNYKKFTKSPLFDFSLLFKSSNEIDEQIVNSSSHLFGGFFVDRENINQTANEASILIKLAHKYKSINFGLIEGETANKLAMLSQLQFIKRPFFVLFNNSNLNQLQYRYVTFSNDINLIETFIDDILSKKQDITSISEKGDQAKLCYNNFNIVINDNQENDILILFSDNLQRRSSRLLYFLAEKALTMINSKYNSKKIVLYTYDLSQNEIPNDLQISYESNNGNSIKALVLYPKGKDKDELYYEGDESFYDMIDFISSSVSFKCEVPDFDEDEVMKDIIDRMNPKFVGFKENLADEREKREKGEYNEESL